MGDGVGHEVVVVEILSSPHPPRPHPTPHTPRPPPSGPSSEITDDQMQEIVGLKHNDDAVTKASDSKVQIYLCASSDQGPLLTSYD